MKKLILSTILWSFIISMQAQEDNYVVFGARLGGGVSMLHGVKNYNDRLPGTNLEMTNFSASPSTTLDIGFVVQAMQNNILFQWDLNYALQRTNIKNAYLTSGIFEEHVKSIQSSYLRLSLNVGSKIPITQDFRLLGGFGPYGGLNLSGLASGNDKANGHNGGNYLVDDEFLDIGEADYKNFDYGISVLAGIEIKNWQIAFNYYHGIKNIVKDIHPIYNRSLQLNFVIFF